MSSRELGPDSLSALGLAVAKAMDVAPDESPLPAFLSPFGFVSRFQRDPLGVLEKLHERHGDVAPFRFFHKRGYLISDPTLIHEVLVKGSANFTKSLGLKRAKVLLGEGLLTSEEPLHMRQRRLVQPAFHRERLRGYGEIMVSEADVWLSRWGIDWKPGKLVNLHHELVELTMAIVSKSLYNSDVRSVATSTGEVSSTLMRMLRVILSTFAGDLLRLHDAKQQLDRRVYSIIAERRASGGDFGDLLSLLLEAQDTEGGGEKMTDLQIHDEIITLFLAGHQTGANALSWAWYLLAKHPESEQDFFDELDRVLGGRAPCADDIDSLPYTYAVFAESMRLYPPLWVIGRISIKKFEMGGRRYPADSIFFISPWIVHRDARFWDKPAEFLPERWMAASSDRPKMTYLPFGAGSRLCIGERFAWMEGVLLLARIGQTWRFRLAPESKVVPQPMITLALKDGLPVVPEKRNLS